MIRSFDGTSLFTCEWQPAQTRGTVVLVHGLGEHIGRYAEVADHLKRAGWRTVGYDHRGHGQSPGPRGDTPQPLALLEDLACVIDATRQSGPLVLLGHSMGGAVVARYTAEGLAARPAPWFRAPDAVVLSSPALAVNMNFFQRALLAFGERFAPGLPAGNGLSADWLSHDAQVVAAYRADAMVHNRITPRLARFIIDAGLAAQAEAANWQVPTLLMWSGADRCVPPAGSARFAAAAPASQLAAKPWPGLFHEIFNEPERAQVLQTVADWLDTRFPPRSPT
jgi:alpha-beta hydrolase superfamily lysophospholipase